MRSSLRTQPLISVIMPMLNSMPHLPQALAAVQAQTYTNLEILLVDSGSTDGSVAHVQQAMKTDSRIRLIQTNIQDISASRNKGVLEASGEWVGFCDSDDCMCPDCYEELLKAATTQNTAIAMGAYRECHYENHISFVRPVPAKPFTCHTAQEAQRYFLTDGKYLTHLWTKLFRRDVFDGVSFPVGRIFEDMAVMPKLLENAKSLTVINRCIYRYLVHKHSTTYTIDIPLLMTGLDVRMDYAAFIAANYPHLLSYAYDAVLSIGANILGKIVHIGREQAPEAWDRTVQVMQRIAPDAAGQCLEAQLTARYVIKNPELLGKGAHFLLKLDGML